MRGWGVIAFLAILVGWSALTMNEDKEMTRSGESQTATGIAVGQKAPDFTLQALDGTSASLSDFRSQPVMINFWATWCPPCRAEMPDMERFYQNHEVEVLAVNLTTTEYSKGEVQQFVAEIGVSFPILLDEANEVASLYQIQPLPTSLFIDREGVIRHINVGPMNEEMMIRVLDQMEF
ncbi:TlpA disulfide reductase family protein [Halalkalibacterium ligniniphilum]|uniref:TlpA disulfide reductase family protein n=1 Tax=Halalkalibacterium ligniniphilum TaxID=1134413 RepID=UPI00034969C7|nr:TlpA disulfide reductase family protein [Halalkalibacterium ligniniphilum]